MPLAVTPEVLDVIQLTVELRIVYNLMAALASREVLNPFFYLALLTDKIRLHSEQSPCATICIVSTVYSEGG